MANTYESKFKGVEVDKGVNIAINLTGTGGITITTSGTGIDTTKTIKITPVQSTGTSTTDVMSQNAVTEALKKKQDELTESSFVNIGTITSNFGSINNLSCTTFEVTGSPINIGTESSSTIALKGSKIDISGSTGIDFYGDVSFSNGITANKYSSLNGIYVDNSTTNPICFKRNNSIVTKMYGPTSGGGELVNVYLPGKSGTFAMTDDLIEKQDTITETTSIKAGSIDLTGNVFFGGQISCNASDGNRSLLSIGYPEGSYTINGPQTVPYHTGPTTYFPPNGGILATTDDITSAITGKQDKLVSGQNIKTINGQSVLGSGNITVGGGSAGVSSIGGTTGAITLGGGLQISGQEMTSNLYCHNVVGQYESSDGLAFAILLTFYNYNSDAYSEIFDTFQDLFEGGVFVLANGGTSVSVPILIGIPKTSGASTGWNPGLFERIESGVITGGALYGNFTGTYTSMTLSEISTVADDVIGPLSA